MLLQRTDLLAGRPRTTTAARAPLCQGLRSSHSLQRPRVAAQGLGDVLSCELNKESTPGPPGAEGDLSIGTEGAPQHDTMTLPAQCICTKERSVVHLTPMQHVACSASRAAVDGWLDMAKLVAGSGGTKSPYDELASAIGRDVYVDLAGWHLYLRDMSAGPGLKMHVALAQQFGPQASKGLRESDVTAVLKKVPVKLGAGRTQLSLLDITPSMCVGDLTKILEEYGRKR